MAENEERKKEKVIHVDKLIIHANNVEYINGSNGSSEHQQQEPTPRWSRWDEFFLGRPPKEESINTINRQESESVDLVDSEMEQIRPWEENHEQGK